MQIMGSLRCVVALVVLYVGLVQSWDIAISKGNIIEFYANGSLTENIEFDTGNQIKALAYNEVKEKLFFVDQLDTGDRICGHDISLNENECYTESNGRNIHSLAYDPVTELLFFSDTNERSINWISLKPGANNNIYGNFLIQTGDAIPTEVAVDSCGGFVYWFNTNQSTPTMERALFNGSDRYEVFNFEMDPHSLAIDQVTQKIYVIVPESNAVHNIWYIDSETIANGGNATYLDNISLDFTMDMGRPSTNTLQVANEFLYWLSWNSDNDYNEMWTLPKTKPTSNSTDPYTHFSLENGVVTGIAVNYKIKDNYVHSPECEPLTNFVQKKSDEPSCVHGRSVCQCTPGYTGEQCSSLISKSIEQLD